MTDSTVTAKRIDGISLAMSGGGYRATLFHLGVLQRLHELGILERVVHFSSVSGGSITAGMLAHDLASHPGANWQERIDRITKALRDFCSKTIDTGTIIGGVLNPFRRTSDLLASHYEDLFGNVQLSSLPNSPTFTFCSTNLQTGRLVHLVRDGIVDYRIGKTSATVSLARAVAASSAFPPFLSPVVIDVGGAPWVPVRDLSTFNADSHYNKKLYLADGGAYDNMGLEPVWDRYTTVLVSDAGAPYKPQPDISTDWLTQLNYVFEIATDQARGVRKRWLIEQYDRNVMAGAYWGIGTELAGYELPDAVFIPPAKAHELSLMRTRLDAFSPTEQADLIDWGYAVSDAAMRKWCGTLCAGANKPTRLPGSGRAC